MPHATSPTHHGLRVLRNASVAVSVAGRHLAQGPDHAAAVTRRLLGRPPATGSPPPRCGNLSEALREARAAGLRGRLRASYLEGELALLRPQDRPLPARRPTVQAAARSEQHSVRVLHLVTNALPEVVAGYTVRTQGIASAQRALGLDAHVATRLGFPVTKGHLNAPAYVEVDGVPHHRTLTRVPLRRDAALALDVARTTRLVERLRPDVLHAHSNHVNAQVALTVGRRLGLPVVYEVRGFIEETRRSDVGAGARSEEWHLTREAESWCLAEADAVITLSGSMRAELLDRGTPAERITVCPNAVPASWLDDSPDQLSGRPAAPLPGFPTLPAGTVVAGVVGTLNHYEGIEVLIRAISAVPGVHLVVVGDGPACPVLSALAAGRPVTLVGRVPIDEVRRWHESIDVFCVPRLDLPVTRLVPPLKPVEAMAAGRPVIASDLPPLRELVRDGETGLLVPAGDVAALAAALDRLARSPRLRRQLGSAARADVAAHRTWTAVAQQCAEVYAALRIPTETFVPEPPARWSSA